MDFPFPITLPEFIIWLGSAGTGGVIVALSLERWSKFKNWKSPLKQWVVISIFVGLPFFSDLGLWAYNRVDPAQLKIVQDVLAKLLFALMAWAASQFAHKADKDSV